MSKTGVALPSPPLGGRESTACPLFPTVIPLETARNHETKFRDVIGLYLNPPDKALVLCCDEKSQWRALERTQAGLPLGVGHIKTRTHGAGRRTAVARTQD